MYSSKIYKSGVDIQIDDVVLQQLRSPAAMKELLKLERIEKKANEVKQVEEDSQERLLNIEKEAYEKGFQTGEKAGLEVAANKGDVIIGRISAIYDEISAFKEKYYKDNEAEILSLIMAAATKVVHEEITVNKEVVLNILKNAVKAVVETEDVQIKLNPEDVKYLRENHSEFIEFLEEAKGFTVIADPELTRAEVLIEGNHSEIDARIETGIKNMEKAVREALSSESDTH